MFTPEVIQAGPVTLRQPAESDAEAMVRACSDPDIVRFIPLVPLPYRRDDALDYLHKIVPDTWDKGGASFVIADGETGEWLGNITLKPPTLPGKSEIGHLVAPWARGRGVASTATRALTEWGLARGLHRIELLTNVENLAGQKVAMRAGFQREGEMRGAEALRDGGRDDLVLFARLRTDPGTPIPRYLPDLPGGALSDGVVRLIPLAPGDTGDFHRMTLDPAVSRRRVPPEPLDLARARTVCRYAGSWWLAGRRAELAIRDAADGAFAGHVQLANIVPELGQGMIGYSLIPEHRGRGFASRAVRLLAGWAFEHTDLARLVAGTAPDNVASQWVLERTGFAVESVQKALIPGPGGARHDDLLWVRLRG